MWGVPERPNGGRNVESDEPADAHFGRPLRDLEDVLLRGELKQYSFDSKGHVGHRREGRAVHLRLAPGARDVLTQLRREPGTAHTVTTVFSPAHRHRNGLQRARDRAHSRKQYSHQIMGTETVLPPRSWDVLTQLWHPQSHWTVRTIRNSTLPGLQVQKQYVLQGLDTEAVLSTG